LAAVEEALEALTPAGLAAAVFAEEVVRAFTAAEDTPVPTALPLLRVLTAAPSIKPLAAAPRIKALEGATRLKAPTEADMRMVHMEARLRGDPKVMLPPEVLRAVWPRKDPEAMGLPPPHMAQQ
jgi:hypothetical protein